MTVRFIFIENVEWRTEKKMLKKENIVYVSFWQKEKNLKMRFKQKYTLMQKYIHKFLLHFW